MKFRDSTFYKTQHIFKGHFRNGTMPFDFFKVVCGIKPGVIRIIVLPKR